MVTEKTINIARNTNLAEILLDKHLDDFQVENKCIRLIRNPKVYVSRIKNIYLNLETGEGGDGIDFLQVNYGYTFEDAVRVLSGVKKRETQKTETRISSLDVASSKTFYFPPHKDGSSKEMVKYMENKGISVQLINELQSLGIMYQEKRYNNIVFKNPEIEWAELNGTDPKRPFQEIKNGSRQDGYWGFMHCRKKNSTPKAALICKSAMEVISLRELKRLRCDPDEYIYISIGDATKQAAIDRLKAKYELILALGHDEASVKTRQRNSECSSITPCGSSWNEDLLRYLAVMRR